MEPSGVETAIRDLEREVKRVQEAISMLRRIRMQRSVATPGRRRTRRRLTAAALRRTGKASAISKQDRAWQTLARVFSSL